MDGNVAIQVDLERHAAEIDAQGYTILERIVPDAMLEDLHEAARQLEKAFPAPGGDPAYDRFRGRATSRVRNLVSRSPAFREAIMFGPCLALAEHMLGPQFLLHATQVIDIGPGEEAQPLHADDMYMQLPRPHRPLICNAIWALSDFTEANGGTRVVPGSHKWPQTPGATFFEAASNPSTMESVAVEMPRGSIVVFDSALWHGGGANRTTDDSRMGVSLAYCVGWMRQQENMQLSVSPEIARTFSPELLALCGFGAYQGLIGAVDGRLPMDALGLRTPA